MSETVTRREALKLGAAAGVLAGAARRAAAATGPKPIRFGFIGVGGRGTGLLQQALAHEGVEVTAICDIDEAHLNRGIDLVRKARGNEPAGHSAGPTDYRRLLTRDDVDAVLIATPMQLHGRMAADSLRAGKHVLSEVAAAVTVDECLDLVRAQKESGRTYMLAENVCYYRANLIVLNMIEQGLFGELTYAECGYVHDCRSLLFNGDGSLTWRG
ncbi:MAG: Gfo/Idh/MocA family oxidoreductase, partial [Armatimonadetes bacterium]|nr:Gfo/Idh/MocA family oxidoreductase [Armatimonadota bacterium]